MKKALIPLATAAALAIPAICAARLPWYYYNENNDRGCTQAYQLEAGFWWVDGYEGGFKAMSWGSISQQDALDTCVEWADGI